MIKIIKEYRKKDGSIYTGQMLKNEDRKFFFLSHGLGKQQFDDGFFYDGEWRNGLCEGQGTLTFANGLVYSGTFY